MNSLRVNCVMRACICLCLTWRWTVCPAGRYGANCELKCSCGKNAVYCDPITGRCHCRPGYFGQQCKQSECSVVKGSGTRSGLYLFVKPQAPSVKLRLLAAWMYSFVQFCMGVTLTRRILDLLRRRRPLNTRQRFSVQPTFSWSFWHL